MGTGRAGQLAGAVMAAVWLVGLVAVDVAVSRPSFIVVPLFALAPLIACSVLPVSATAAFAAAATAAAVGSGSWNHTWGTDQHVIRMIDVAVVSVAAVAIAAVRVRRERRYARVAAIAEVAQRAILPTLPRMVGPVAAAARYVSAAEDAFVGGDLYDCYHSDAYTRFLVGDVRGKGMGAVEQAARVIRAFRQSAAVVPSLPMVAAAMSSYLVPFLDDEEFVTASLVDVSDPGSITVVSCGHPPPVLLTSDRHVSLIEPPVGLPLGLGENYSAAKEAWWPGARVLMYTDGLSEARDRRGQFLSPLSLAPALTADTVDEALDLVLDMVRGHVPRGRLHDDLAVVLLEYVGSDQSPEAASPDRAKASTWLPVTADS